MAIESQMGIERDDIDRIATASADQVMEQVGERAEESEPSAEAAPCNPIPLKQWIAEEDSEEDPEACRACILPVTMGWYYEALTERGLHELATELDTVRETGDTDKVAEVMDSIKERVGPDVAQRLREFDCATQEFEPTEEDLQRINAGITEAETEG